MIHKDVLIFLYLTEKLRRFKPLNQRRRAAQLVYSAHHLKNLSFLSRQSNQRKHT